MRYPSNQHMEMSKRLDERTKKHSDPKKAKRVAAVANVFRLLAEKAAKQARNRPDGGDRVTSEPQAAEDAA